MFATAQDVKDFTGYEVPEEAIYRAQVVIEAYIGRTEDQVTENANDLTLLMRAICYQTVYQEHDLARTFGQAKAQQILQYGNMVSFFDDGYSPWIAPLAAIACRNLSWNKTRSVTVAPMFTKPVDRREWIRE